MPSPATAGDPVSEIDVRQPLGARTLDHLEHDLRPQAATGLVRVEEAVDGRDAVGEPVEAGVPARGREGVVDVRRSFGADDVVDSTWALIARDALAIFPETEWKEALLEAVDFCVSRAH